MQDTLLQTKTEENIMSYVSYVTQIFFLCLAYVLTGNIGFSFEAMNDFGTLIWIPAGIALAAILVGGYRLWPAVFIGSFLINAMHGAAIIPALGIATGNTLEAVIATYLLIYFVHFRNTLDRTYDILGLIFIAAPAGALISATIGVASLYLGNTIHITQVFETWGTWILGDYLSATLITPLLLIWYTHPSVGRLSAQKMLEGTLIILILTICLCIILITGSFTYIIFPPLIWLALRFHQKAIITAIIVMAGLAFVATINNVGPFEKEQIQDSFWYLQAFTGVVGLTTLALSVIANEHKQLEKRKDEFISIASHELKIPITSMTIFLQLLQRINKKKKDEHALDLIDKTTKQMKRMTNLIGDLLDVSKIQIGKLELKKEKITLNELIHDAVESTQGIMTTHAIVIDGQSKKKIYGDRERISQVLTNLLNNAAKYSPNAYKILVSIRTTKNSAIIQVTDFGIGIAKKDQQKIFERFFRVEGTDERTYPGFGIGLYIAKEIIRLHNGVLWVESMQGHGSTFSLSLPLAKRTQSYTK